MESTTYASRLRYLDAGDVENAAVDYDGLDVYGADGEKLGDVDGFIIDPDAGRVNYIVIDSGGWFTSRRLLLPIGHATLSSDRKSLRADATREALRHLPEFDEQRFHQLQDEELRAFERATVVACCPDEPLEDASVRTWSYDSGKHYRQPDWWSGSRYAPERLRTIDRSAFSTSASTAGTTTGTDIRAPRDAYNRDLVTAREGRDARPEQDPSPHLDGRAQPGDVLGIESGGEVTGLGETTEDEDKRRRDAERAAADDRADVDERTRQERH